mmetsp:Transcript_36897/g.68101  ORF Transcript_36897/g.68101 Transcript_36897/m.68101 type:complete len:328 (+) Transcript_36897:1127-2110(+)
MANHVIECSRNCSQGDLRVRGRSNPENSIKLALPSAPPSSSENPLSGNTKPLNNKGLSKGTSDQDPRGESENQDIREVWRMDKWESPRSGRTRSKGFVANESEKQEDISEREKSQTVQLEAQTNDIEEKKAKVDEDGNIKFLLPKSTTGKRLSAPGAKKNRRGSRERRRKTLFGGGQGYYIGIVDILSQWDMLKKGEYLFKSKIRGGGDKVTVLPPEKYCERFREFIFTVIETYKSERNLGGEATEDETNAATKQEKEEQVTRGSQRLEPTEEKVGKGSLASDTRIENVENETVPTSKAQDRPVEKPCLPPVGSLVSNHHPLTEGSV